MSDTPSMQPVVVRMPDDLYNQLKQLAASEDRTVSQTIRRALKQYVRESSVA